MAACDRPGVIGFYDGAIGPGTGSFLVFALVGLIGYTFLEASAKAKIANLATNLGALLCLRAQGAVMWKVGLLMGLQPGRRLRRRPDRGRRAGAGSCGCSSWSWSARSSSRSAAASSRRP